MNQSRRDFLKYLPLSLAGLAGAYVGSLGLCTFINHVINKWNEKQDLENLPEKKQAPWGFKMPANTDQRKLLMHNFLGTEITTEDAKKADFLVIHRPVPFSFWFTNRDQPELKFYSRSRIREILSARDKSTVSQKMDRLDKWPTLDKVDIDMIKEEIEIYRGTTFPKYKDMPGTPRRHLLVDSSVQRGLKN